MDFSWRDQVVELDQSSSVGGSPVKPVPGRIALIGNFLPRLCGIATFTFDVHAAFAERFGDVAIDVYAMNDRGKSYDYPDAVVGSIDQDSPDSYLEAARTIEASGADLVFLQHEYGIFGGPAGDMILKLLDRVTMPVTVMFHTILSEPDADQRRVTEALVRRGARLIVMADHGRELLIKLYGARPSQVVVIPHGIPDRPFVDTAPMKQALGLAGRDVILTFGLLSPGKGIETMIEAMPEIVARYPKATYLVIGATHPHLVAQEGEAYRDRLLARAEQLGLADHFQMIDGFFETDTLLDYLTATDIYVTPYLNPAQVTSGTLSYAVGLGKPVVSTPYVHAGELLKNDHGRLVDFGDSAGFAREIISLLGDRAAMNGLRKRTYALGRTMIWPRLAEAAMDAFGAAIAAAPAALKPPHVPPAIPEKISIGAIERLTDATGMVQHSIFSVPDRDHGYCVDDNCRALMLVHSIPDLDDADYDRLSSIYAAFVQHAWNPDTNRFRNFMGFNRQWLEAEGSDDSSARTLWSLGVTARDARRQGLRRWGAALYDQVAAHALELVSPRSQAFSMLAAAAMIEAHPGHRLSHEILERGADALMALVDRHRRPDWAWFEIVLAYDNCRLPEALLRAGRLLARKDYIDRGIETLEWIVSQQTAKSGLFRPVGSESFGRAYAAPLPFDQQPVEAWATIDACALAAEITGEQRWIDEATRAYCWFLGDNDLTLPLANPATGECFDGLMPSGVNENQGAESVLAFHLATAGIKALLVNAADKSSTGRASAG